MAKKKRTLVVGVGGARQAGSDFVRTWKRAEAGLPVEHPVKAVTVRRARFEISDRQFACR
ncbi:MAG: hypothetical protein IPM23_27085 [Candidatus Melainabacteria bacterium]|nr:hypothetical protein [Candidatus Melainabacteria bacterium]